MKKIISLALVLILCLSVSVTGHAETTSDAKIRQLLARLDVMVGDSDGNFYPENPVTRAEFIKVAIMASPYRDAVPETSSTSPFGDVPYTLWSAPYIALGADSGLISGYPDSTFRPDNTVLLEEGVTVCLKLLGYTEADYGKVWPAGPMSLARSLELLENVDKSTNETLLRKDVMQLIYNTLNTKMKGSQFELISVPGYTYLEDTVIIATREQDKSIGKDRVLTSAGTFKTEETIPADIIGQKGDAFVKNGDTLVVFVPYTQTQNLHTVYSVINNDILIYENGSAAVLDADSDLICHSGKSTAPLSSLRTTFKTGDILRVVYDADGDMDYLVHEKDNLDGPFVVYNDNWMAANGIDTSASVIRNGKNASLSDVTLHDLVYYSGQMNMVWAYNKRITGTYEKAIPNQDTP
ncbi:MAG: S-layer homology domain-containing protein, partial [Clostridia bacterium]|nr:S-layer homology domain-containing protein [Clostridia bacterium]